MRMGGKSPRTNNKQQKQKIMTKQQNIWPIFKLETNEKIRDLAADRGQMYCRVAIKPAGNDDTLTDAQKALLAKLSEKQRNTTLRGQLEREVSNIFPLSVFADYVDGLEEICTNEEYFGEEGQNEVISELAKVVIGEKFIFTYYTENVGALLQGTEYDGISVLYAETAENGVRPIHSRNNLYFGFFDAEEECFSFMQSRLIADIKNETLLVENPNGTNESEEKPKETEKPKKPLFSLKK
jgi:hypothetical protein